MAQLKYGASPVESEPKQHVIIPETAENLLWAQVRYYRDMASGSKGETSVSHYMKANGLIESYALLTGCSFNEAREAYHKNRFGGEGLYY